MTIWTRLLSIGATSALLMMLLAFAGFTGLQRSARAVDTVVDRDVELALSASQLSTGLLQLRRYEKDLFLHADDAAKRRSYADKFRAAHGEFREILDTLEDEIDGSERRRELGLVVTAFERYVGGVEDIVRAMDSGAIRTPGEANAAIEPLKQTTYDLESISEKLMTSARETMNQRVAEQREATRTTLALIAALSLGGIALGGVVFFAIAAGIRRRLRSLSDQVSDICRTCDMQRRVEVVGADEIADVAMAFNALIARIQEMLGSIGRGVLVLGESSAMLLDLSGKLNQSASRCAEQSDAAARLAQAVDSGVNNVAAGAEEMSASIREIARNATGAAQAAMQALETAKQTKSAVGELGESSSEIGTVTQVITTIAEQTNLLALNATIEAARAGEAGKGFAVVANEVQQLAHQTKSATDGVGSRVCAIQASVESVVASIDRISNVVDGVSDMSATIAGAVEEQSSAMAEITRAAVESAKGTHDISRAIESVAASVDQSAAGAQSAQGSAEALARAADDLRRVLDQFHYVASAAANPSRATQMH